MAMIVKSSMKLHHTQDRFVIVELGVDETTKQGVIRFTTSDGQIGREVSVAEIFRDAKMYECWPLKARTESDSYGRI